MTTPEQRARENIDTLLRSCGWQVQDRDAINLGAGLGVAVREFSLKTGFADYLLFVNRKAIGAVEAKSEGKTLSGVESQSLKYSQGLPTGLPSWHTPLPFLYESTGVETFFTNGLDPDPRGRRVFAFHRPETLHDWANESQTLRARLKIMPPLLSGNLWSAQIEAISNLERSFADDRPRALIQMATGSGKTFTAVNFIYRLIKHGKARRVLFLVDRSNLGRQTLKEFQQFVTPDDGRKFTELYNVQLLSSNTVDPVSKVCITTIQRLYSMLSGEPDLPAELEEQSMDVIGDILKVKLKDVQYNQTIPIEYFDFIVTDECHRSIYNLWRQVLEYFDSHLVGLTATPSKQTFGFFNQNLVMEYTRQRAVADGVNVDGQVYVIRTEISQSGSQIEAGFDVVKRDKVTRARRWETLDQDLVYDAGQLDREVLSESQIRTIIRTYRERLFTDLFPGRHEVPKTLIFAKDDAHAEEIVRMVREEFGKGNEFCQKITYKVSGKKPEELISDLRNNYNPRIAVTVDMIATGTDIKPLEVLLFMRQVQSRNLFEQMLGRGTRTINSTDLQAVTPDAEAKKFFIIIDAIGVVDRIKVDTQTLERKRSVSFAKLVERVAQGATDEDTLTSLAGRLARLERTLPPEDAQPLRDAAGGKSLRELANALLDAYDLDKHVEATQALTGHKDPSAEEIALVATEFVEKAVRPFDDPLFRKLLNESQARNEITIDDINIDTVLEAGYSATQTDKTRQTIESFREYLLANRDEITALQIIYNQPHAQQRLTFKDIKELAAKLKQPPHNWTPDELWNAFAQVEKDKVHGAGGKRVLTDLVALVRHAVDPQGELVPYPEEVFGRYQRWLLAHESAGKIFTPQQRWWLDKIAEFIGVNLSIDLDDFNNGDFYNQGGIIAVSKVFGGELPSLLDELNRTLVA